MIRILVTGANGQLGSQLKMIADSYNNLSFFFTDLPEFDISSSYQIDSAFEKYKPNWLINCAAYTAVDKAEADQELAELINSQAPALLATSCEQHNCRMIHVSTDYVFDGNRSRPYKEDHEKNPNGVYARTKSVGEDLVLYNNSGSIIIRTSWLYSAFGNNFMKTMIRLAKEKGHLRVVADQVGTPTWTGDLAWVILTAISNNIAPGIYHFSNEGICSWYDFAKAIIELDEIDATVEPITTKDYPTAAPRPYYSVLDKSLIKATLSLTIPHWRDSLKVCLKEFNEQG